MNDNPWIWQVLGDPNGGQWEISVVRKKNVHGQRSYGWFDDAKLLVSHSGGPCYWPLAPGLGNQMIQIAKDYAAELNFKEGNNE